MKEYVLGISSGLFGAAQQEEKISYVGISQKAFFGALKGVKFTQIDLEAITEFIEPDLVDKVNKLKEMGLRFGIHGETYAMGGREVPLRLDSSLMDDWRRSHERLLDAIDGCAKIEAEYLLLHASESMPFLLLWREFQPADVVDIWGRSFREFLQDPDNDWLVKWFFDQKKMVASLGREISHYTPENNLKRQMENFRFYNRRNPTPEETEILKKLSFEDAKKELLETIHSTSVFYGIERFAYYLIAKWMSHNKDPLWIKIVGDEDFTEEIMDNHEKWVPAVASKYIWGHFNPETCPSGQLHPDPKKKLEEKGMYFVFETGMAMKGYEKLMRLARPLHMIYLSEEIPCKYFGVAMDFEHMMGAFIDPEEEIASMPEGAGEKVHVLHLGWPTPLQPAHLPIPAGSDEQLYIYERLYELRKKGFKGGFIIFERGGGKDPVQHTIGVLRLVIKYLEKNTPPDKLPEDFFGVGETSIHSFRRQWNVIFEHAFSPLKGLIKFPEEEHTLLGKSTIEKGKRPEEWKKEELR